MTEERDVLEAAERRAEALASGDAAQLAAMLHPSFVWTSHKGDVFDRETYVASNTSGTLTWKKQRLENVDVKLVGSTAILTGTVIDDVEQAGRSQRFEMPITQVWLKERDKWLCLAGHAGPLSS